MRCLAFPIVAILAVVAAGTRGSEDDDLARERKLVQGNWKVAAYDHDGTQVPAGILKKMSVRIASERLVISPKVVVQRKMYLDGRKDEVQFVVEEGKTDEVRFQFGRTGKRKVIELTQDVGRGQSGKIKGLYSLASDRLTICIPLADRKVPQKMPTSPKAGMARLVLEPAKPMPANSRPDGK
jgi:uncharacterized protein (TIGR03067 family)